MKLIKYLLVFSIASSSLHANEDASLIQTEFKVFPVSSFDDSGIFYKPSPEEAMQELRFRPRARSLDSYDYRGRQPLTFFREGNLDAEGIMQYLPIAQVNVTSGEMLIFFSPQRAAEDGSAEFSLLGIDDGPNALPVNHVTFLNFMNIPFACRFMDTNSVIKPGPNPPISVEERLAEDVFIGLAVTNKESHRVVLKSRWQFHPNNRHYVLLLPPAREGSFRIRAFQVSEYVGADGRFVGR
jgi:hypothetical protein